MMDRPKGWKNPYKSGQMPYLGALRLEGISRITLNTAGQAYEAGADAIIEALMNTGAGVRLDIGVLGMGFTKPTKAEVETLGWWAYEQCADSDRGQGTLIFIPDKDTESKKED